MEKKKRLQKRVKRIDDRFIKKGGQTDMDIAEHEARLKRLADKGGFTPPHEGWHSQFLAKSPLNQVEGFEKIDELRPAQGYFQQKLSNIKGKLKENKKEIGVIGAVATSMIPLGGVIKAAQGLRAVKKIGKSAKAMKGIVDKYGARANTFLEKEKFSKRAKTFLEPDLKLANAPKPKPKLKSTDAYANFTPTEIKRAQGMNTPLKPNLTPKNPRGHETVTLKGGRKVVKPGTPGRGGKPTYNEKNPLWPTFEGTNIDKILYPRNWKK